ALGNFSTERDNMPSPCPAQATMLCCGSASRMATLRPMAANSAARFPTMVDLPTPPLRPATAMIAIEVHDKTRWAVNPLGVGQGVCDMEVSGLVTQSEPRPSGSGRQPRVRPALPDGRGSV